MKTIKTVATKTDTAPSVPKAPAGMIPEYGLLLDKISGSFAAGQRQTAQAVNTAIVQTYWEIGRHIVEFEQKGNLRAIYGEKLLERLSRDLTLRHGKGFHRSNLNRIRQFFLAYPKCATLSHKLSWGHVAELVSIDDPLERGFYEKQAILENWSIRELRRQKQTSLFLRFASGKNKAEIMQLAKQGAIIETPEDLLRSPYVCHHAEGSKIKPRPPHSHLIISSNPRKKSPPEFKTINQQ